MVRPGGRVAQVGTSGGQPVAIPTHLLFRGATITMPVMAEARHFYQAIQFVATRSERFDFSKIISGEFPLEGTGEALRRMADFEEVKPLITPHGVAMPWVKLFVARSSGCSWSSSIVGWRSGS